MPVLARRDTTVVGSQTPTARHRIPQDDGGDVGEEELFEPLQRPAGDAVEIERCGLAHRRRMQVEHQGVDPGEVLHAGVEPDPDPVGIVDQVPLMPPTTPTRTSSTANRAPVAATRETEEHAGQDDGETGEAGQTEDDTQAPGESGHRSGDGQADQEREAPNPVAATAATPTATSRSRADHFRPARSKPMGHQVRHKV